MLKVRKNGQQKASNLSCNIAAKRVDVDVDVVDVERCCAFYYHIKPVLQQIRLLTGLMWVEKRATSLFISFCSNVAVQVARFLLPVFPYL